MTITVKQLEPKEHRSFDNDYKPYDVEIPDSITCPHCQHKHKIEPQRSFFTYKEGTYEPPQYMKEITPGIELEKKTIRYNDIISICLCPKCKNTFIARYRDYIEDYFTTVEFLGTYPPLIEHHEFPPLIHKISPDFIKIYKDAETAEQQNLDNIVGMGYRKSLEFLVKKFITVTKLDTEENIKNKSLKECIEKYLSDSLLSCAGAANKLGNDHTHFYIKHKDYNLKDLKDLILQVIKLISLNQELISLEQNDITLMAQNIIEDNKSNNKK